MAPQTRSISSKRSTISISDHSSKRQKQLQPPFPPSKSRYTSRFLPVEILPGRIVDLGFFNEEGFNFGKWFKDFNWVSKKQHFYPELVRIFYENLSYDADKTVLYSVVKGKEIRLDQNVLGKILGIANVGNGVYDMGNWVDEDVGVGRLEALRLVFDRPDLSEVTKANSCDLKLEMRLLHQIVVHVIVPRKRSFNYVSDLDLVVMWHIVKEKAFNVPFVMLNHIVACSEKKNGCFPYGMILTSVFEHCGVSLEGEESRELKGCSVYNEVTLRKMGYVKTERGWCLKKDKGVVCPSLVTVFDVNVSEAQGDSIASSESNSNPVSEDGNKTSSLASSAAETPEFDLAAEYLRSTWGDKQASLVASIFLVLESMKEDMRSVTLGTRHLRGLVTQLGSQWQQKKAGDVFLLLEVIIGDMRNSRFKMDTFGGKIDCLQSQLTEFLNIREDWGPDDKVNIEWMISEAVTLRTENRDTIHIYETIRSEIQDVWDSLSSRM
ncbi:hypothetical protein M5689_015169 [Euphorbia peplus]|nr:hypothetical protein M5689_015169 [Euphorbia peplus]